MDRDLMRKLVDEELDRIPRGPKGSQQNSFRACYETLRMHSLSKEPASVAFHKALEQIRKSEPGYVPKLADADYVMWSE